MKMKMDWMLHKLYPVLNHDVNYFFNFENGSELIYTRYGIDRSRITLSYLLTRKEKPLCDLC